MYIGIKIGFGVICGFLCLLLVGVVLFTFLLGIYTFPQVYDS